MSQIFILVHWCAFGPAVRGSMTCVWNIWSNELEIGIHWKINEWTLNTTSTALRINKYNAHEMQNNVFIYVNEIVIAQAHNLTNALPCCIHRLLAFSSLAVALTVLCFLCDYLSNRLGDNRAHWQARNSRRKWNHWLYGEL